MTDENTADTTANDDISSTEQVDQTATPEVEKVELTPEQQAEAEAKAEDQKQADESRTQKRRRQRNKRDLRIANEATRKAEIDAAYWKGKAEASGSKAETEGDKEPQQDDFESYDEYIDAKVDWKFAQANKSQEKPTATAPKDKPSPDQSPNESPEFTTFKQAGTEKYGEDWSDMLEAAQNNEFPTSQLMAETMMTEDNGVDMAMHFYDHPEDATRISQLSPLKQVAALTELGEKLGAVSKPTPAKKISGAPEPVSTERGTSANEGGLKNLSMNDYVNKRRKQKTG